MFFQTLHLQVNIVQTLNDERFNISQFINHKISYKQIIIHFEMVYLLSPFSFDFLFIIIFVSDVSLHSLTWVQPHFLNVYFKFIFCSVESILELLFLHLLEFVECFLTLLLSQLKLIKADAVLASSDVVRRCRSWGRPTQTD